MKLKKVVKSLVNRTFDPWGMELAYSHLVMHPKNDWLQNLRVQTILDIGANKGQFAARIREILPEAFIYSFEPLRDAHEALLSRMEGDNAFQTFNFALGDENAKAVIHRSGYSQSSSLLPMLELHTEAWPHTAEAGTENVVVRRLDGLNLLLKPRIMVKIDVQGFEDRVIAGGRVTIGGATCVITEVSFQKLYDGQLLFDDIHFMLRDMGFQYSGNWDQLLDPRDGRPLQADAIFINPDNAN